MEITNEERAADKDFWRNFSVDQALRNRIDQLRPSKPYWISPTDPAAMARWAASWRVAAAIAEHAAADDGDREKRQWVWFASRNVYGSTIPLK